MPRVLSVVAEDRAIAYKRCYETNEDFGFDPRSAGDFVRLQQKGNDGTGARASPGEREFCHDEDRKHSGRGKRESAANGRGRFAEGERRS